MPSKILELRRKVGGSFNNGDSLSYVRTNWAGIDGKPLVYPPAGHTHPISQVTGLQTELNAKLNATAKGETANKTLTYSGTFKVLQAKVDGTVEERTMTLPAAASIPDVMPIQEGTDGTSTTVRTINANNLRQIIEDYITTNDSYLTGISGSGNGTVTLTRRGLGNLTWDASHNHNSLYNTKAEITSLLAGKQNTITGGASSIASSNLTINRALVSDAAGKVVVSGITATELGRLSGVGDNIQTQLNGKLGNSGMQQITGGHGSTVLKLFYDDIPSRGSTLGLWASEPGITYHGAGIGYNLTTMPHGTSNAGGVIDTDYAASWIRFDRSEVTAGQRLTDGTIRINTLLSSSGHLLETGSRVYSPNNKPSWGDIQSKPSIMSVAEGTTGTDTTARIINAYNLKGIIQGLSPIIPGVMPIQEGSDGTSTTTRTINANNLRQIVESLSPPGARPANDVQSWAKSSQAVVGNRFLTVNNNVASWRTNVQMRSDLGLGTLAISNGLALNDLTNVTFGGTPTAGQVLAYGAGVWTNITPSSAYEGMPISRTISVDNTFDLLSTDLNKLIIVNPPSGCMFQITTTFNNAAPIGSEVQFFKKNASAVELYSMASGVSLLSEGNKIMFGAPNTMVAIKKISSTEWIMVGALQ